MARITIRLLVTQDLHYCCLWFFLTRFRRTSVVADRLGVSPQAVRQARASCTGCEGKSNCMDREVTMRLTPRKSASREP